MTCRLWLFLPVILFISGCEAKKPEPKKEQPYPRLIFQPQHSEIIQKRIGREPYKTAWETLQKTASSAWSKPGEIWDAGTWSHNAQVAQANAVIAWVADDATAAGKAKQFMLDLDTDWNSNEHFDINISMPRVLIPYTNALDLLRATPWITPAEDKEAERRIAEVARQFAARYMDEAFYRHTALVVTQNNHPIRTASTMGYVGLAFPGQPESQRWLNWAVGEMDYLLGPLGHYIQPDGGITEGPFYGQFAFAPALTFLIALDNVGTGEGRYTRDCLSRNPVDPWIDFICVQDEPYKFANPLHSEWFRRAWDWLVSVRMPSGQRAHVNDTKLAGMIGGPILTGFGAPGYLTWDWQTHVRDPKELEQFFYLAPWFLGYFDDSTAATPPPWKTRFFPNIGHAIFRSGWDADDIWLMLVADNGPARKTLHNHSDGTAFALSAYGEDLLIDTGYYKPNDLNNPVTMHHPAHSVVLVDDAGAPERGLLNDWGDVDAFLENTVEGNQIAWAEARQSYQQFNIRRGVAFVRERYFIVADRIDSDLSSNRKFQWRAHLGAGWDLGGQYSYQNNRAQVIRDLAGLELAVTTTVGAPKFLEPPFEDGKAPHVHQFHETIHGHHAVVDATIQSAEPNFLAVLAPYRKTITGPTDDGKMTVTSIAAPIGSAAWMIQSATGKREIAWIRQASAQQVLQVSNGPKIESDAEVIIVSLDDDIALIASGSRLVLNGKTLIQGEKAPVKVRP